MKIKEGNFDAKGLAFSIVVSRFNEVISKSLLEGALDCLKRHGVTGPGYSRFYFSRKSATVFLERCQCRKSYPKLC